MVLFCFHKSFQTICFLQKKKYIIIIVINQKLLDVKSYIVVFKCEHSLFDDFD